MTSRPRFDAVLFDAGGILVLPDPAVIGPLLAFYGGNTDPSVHHRAHYGAMAARSRAGAAEPHWDEYDRTYVELVGVPTDDRAEAAAALGQTRNAWIWRWTPPDAATVLTALIERRVPVGVVSNADGQVEAMLGRLGVCQVGDGAAASMRCIVDSHVVGFTKPDPRIFDAALEHFTDIERDRIAYVGDSVTMDVEGARAAALHPLLLDPYDDHPGADFDRIARLGDLLPLVGGG